MTVSVGKSQLGGSAKAENVVEDTVGGAIPWTSSTLARAPPLHWLDACGKSDGCAYILKTYNNLTSPAKSPENQQYSDTAIQHIVALRRYHRHDYRHTITTAVAHFVPVQVATVAGPFRSATAGTTVSALQHAHNNCKRARTALKI